MSIPAMTMTGIRTLSTVHKKLHNHDHSNQDNGKLAIPGTKIDVENYGSFTFLPPEPPLSYS